MAVPPAGQPCEVPLAAETTLADPHLSRWTLDDIPGLKRRLWVHRHEQPSVCVERARLLTRATPSIHNDDAMVPVLQGLGFSTAMAIGKTSSSPG